MRFAPTRAIDKRDCDLVWRSTFHAVRSTPRAFWLSWLAFLVISAVFLLPADLPLLEWIRRESPAGSMRVVKFLSKAGEFRYVIVSSTLLLLTLAWLRKDSYLRRVAFSVFLAGTMSVAAVQVIKTVVGRPRPIECVRNHVSPTAISGPTFKYRRHGYPSGHTAIAVAACVVLATAFPQWILPCILFCVLTAWGRICGQSHFPLDTIHGAVLGYACAFLCTRWIEVRKPVRNRAIVSPAIDVEAATS